MLQFLLQYCKLNQKMGVMKMRIGDFIFQLSSIFIILISIALIFLLLKFFLNSKRKNY